MNRFFFFQFKPRERLRGEQEETASAGMSTAILYPIEISYFKKAHLTISGKIFQQIYSLMHNSYFIGQMQFLFSFIPDS